MGLKEFFRKKISRKFISLFFIILLVTILIISSFFYFQTKINLEKETKSHLLSVAQSRAKHIENYFLDQIKKAKDLDEKTEKQLKKVIEDFKKQYIKS